MSYETELAAALTAADAAGRLILEHYERFVAIPDAPSDISTATDHAAQEVILQQLRAAFPHDALCAEEPTPTLASAPRTGDRLWIVDPIDGTRGFARKNGEFCVMIGFADKGEMVAGVVLEPVRRRFTFAAKGLGCWRRIGVDGEQERCTVGAAATLADATVTQSRSSTARRSAIMQKLNITRLIETYSAGLKLALVASGEADIYVNVYPEFHDWDIGAGHILVAEAGGKATRLNGEPIRYGAPGHKQRGGLLATNGRLHEAITDVLRQIEVSRGE